MDACLESTQKFDTRKFNALDNCVNFTRSCKYQLIRARRNEDINNNKQQLPLNAESGNGYWSMVIPKSKVMREVDTAIVDLYSNLFST